MATLRVLPRDIGWLPWSAGAFSRARTEIKPVLLCIAAPWSHACHEMDRTSYADPSIASLINSAFVPVRVDADRRPDISERYSLGGWPTTAFLTADGEVLGGGTFIPMSRIVGVLEQVRAVFPQAAAARAAADAGREAPRSNADAPLDIETLCARIFGDYDDAHGGFGRGVKFPHAAPLRLALERHRRMPDERLETIVKTTLDAMGWGGLYDEADGGFYRYSATPDWQDPHREKTLEVNAQMLRLYADAAATLDIARFGERAADVLRYVQNWLADVEDGGWYGSQRGVDGSVDRTFFADANAVMGSAALRAAAIFDDSPLREFALKSLERVLLACYRPGGGVAHYFDGRPHVRGLLNDQIAMATAQLDAYEATQNIVYEMMAEELARYAVREMWDPEGGGFFDRAAADDGEAVGLMRVRMKPFVANCEAGRMLVRLAAASGDDDFARFGRQTLEAIAPAAAAQGPLAAHYVLALEQAG